MSNDEKTNYLDELDELEDDFDVEVKFYRPPPLFKSFVLNPFPYSEFGKKVTVICKTGQLKLPKDIIEIYQTQRHWNFENYHHMELMALLYLHYYKDCDEWKTKPKLLECELQEILEALPHFRNISELLSYAFINGDLKYHDFEQVIESDVSGSYDVTGVNDN